MSEIVLRPINKADHAEDALDLAQRAADYVILEVGHAPDAAFINDFFDAVPPGLTTADLMTFGVMQEQAMTGIVCIAEGYELPTDWWIGLVLLDPAYRGSGIGRTVLHLIKTKARRARMTMLKLAVLEANPRAMHFWTREGFVPHRYAPATPQSDGHNRWVLKYQL
ncbi:GNAT family N-acetyltransferase [Roseobacter sp. YSTF-M11]|uniref:GNAT family N-acetyltransferase n=1 Tax=Roseobacter insulae TaxID=2859783 RepID=A0A9X1K0M4_9RHOB|nr:GNAT family N-acetyltransferase [Roseobacter insulae]MBW4708329.1 GNAT family N-acetyltransferase [Roseobacter insulae]